MTIKTKMKTFDPENREQWREWLSSLFLRAIAKNRHGSNRAAIG
jgi:hypothetical protein